MGYVECFGVGVDSLILYDFHMLHLQSQAFFRHAYNRSTSELQ